MACLCLTACPTRPMPCNSDDDCDSLRNRCDTTEPRDGAAGTCVSKLIGGGSTSGDPGTTSSSGGASSSSGGACVPPCQPGQRCTNGLCVCDTESCPAGCCDGNRCELI